MVPGDLALPRFGREWSEGSDSCLLCRDKNGTRDRGSAMAKVKTRIDKSGKPRYTAVYRTPDGGERSAGTFSNKQVAREKAVLAEAEARQAGWVDPRDGNVSVTEYAET